MITRLSFLSIFSQLLILWVGLVWMLYALTDTGMY